MRWMFISSTAISSNGSDTGSVVSRARSQLTRSKCEWTKISCTIAYFNFMMGYSCLAKNQPKLSEIVLEWPKNDYNEYSCENSRNISYS